MECRYCGSERVKRNGSSKNVRRCVCKECGRSFAVGKKGDEPDVEVQVIKTYRKPCGIRKPRQAAEEGKPLKCHHCGSDKVKKNGTNQGIQRYICKACKRSFAADVSVNVKSYEPSLKKLARKMYLENCGIRSIGRIIGPSSSTILRWLCAQRKELAEQLHQAGNQVLSEEPDIIEMDEIYTYVQKKSHGSSFGLLIVGNSVALLPLS